MKAKIVLIHFPFTDLSDSKLRPAVVIVAFISSRVPPALPSSDLLITPEHPAFTATGLKISSVIRFDKVATLSKTLIEGEIGEVVPGLTSECNRIMGDIFRL
jgi:mRNA interferase MazF